MRLLTRIVCVMAAVAAVAARGPGAAAAAPEMIAWAHGLEAAQADAKARNVPLLVVLNMDREPGNERMVAEVYTAPAVRAAAKRCAVTVASISRHPETEEPPAHRKVCSRFGSVSCDEHCATEEVVRREWLKRGPRDDVESPRHVFRAPDGRLLFERVWTLEAEELVALIDRAVAACAPESLAAWDTTAGRLARVSDPIDCIRRAALRELAGAHDDAIDARLFDLVHRTDKEDVAREVLAAMSSDLSPARAEGMRKLLAATAPAVRMQAAAALVTLQGKESSDALAAAFAKEKQAEVRCVLLRAFAAAGGDPAKTRETVLRHAKTADPPLRVHAVVALAPWAAEPAVVDALRKLPVSDKVPNTVRTAAVWALGLSGRPEVAEDWKALAEERDETLRRTVDAATKRLARGKPDPQYLGWRRYLAPMPVTFAEGGN